MLWWKRLESSLQALLLLTVVSAVLHLGYAFVTAPPVLNQDEAAILLNARFLAQAGKDEWQQRYPLVFRSFGDAKLPGYISFVFLIGKFVGFSSMVVRVPSMIAGLLFPVLLFVFTKRITGSKGAGLCAVFLGILSPWTYHYASIGFESHTALSLFLGSLILLFSDTPSSKKDLGAAVLAVLAGLTYNSPFLLLPFVGCALVIRRWGEWKSLARIGVLLLCSFAVIFACTWGATSQKKGIAFFQDGTVLSEYPEYRAQHSGVSQKLLGNKYIYFAGIAGTHSFDSFSWNFLVLRGGANPWHTIPNTGHFAFMVLPSFAIGLGILIRYSLTMNPVRLQSLALGSMLVSSLVPAVITTDAPHATRSLFFFVLVLVISGIGLYHAYEQFCTATKGWSKHFGLGTLATLFIGSFAIWWVPAHSSWEKNIDPHWYLGLEEALSHAEVKAAERIFVVDPEGVLYTRVAAYENVGYSEFVESVRRSPPATTGLVRVEALQKYEFIFQPSDARGPGVMLEQQRNGTWSRIVL